MEISVNQKPSLHVAVGILFNDHGQVLIAQRPQHVIGGGFWEFPGGKVEPREDVQTALCRELHEELGIDVKSLSPLIKYSYEYPDRKVLLDVWEVLGYDNTPVAREGQVLKWADPQTLFDYNLLTANRSIVTAIRKKLNLGDGS